MDPVLSRKWFERDIRSITDDPDTYAQSGIKLVRKSFPTAVVEVDWKKHNRRIWLHIQADNYDYLPASAWWVDENDRQLAPEDVPVGGGFQCKDNPNRGGGGWLCFPGWREYHDHRSHQNVPWQSLRGNPEYRLPAILVQLSRDLNKVEVGG